MNRKNDKHFFDCWDLMKRIEALYDNVTSPRDQLEIMDLEAALADEGGFAPFTDYQTAIQDYKDKHDQSFADEYTTK